MSIVAQHFRVTDSLIDFRRSISISHCRINSKEMLNSINFLSRLLCISSESNRVSRHRFRLTRLTPSATSECIKEEVERSVAIRQIIVSSPILRSPGFILMHRIRSDERLYQSTSRKLLQVSRIVLLDNISLIFFIAALIELTGSASHRTPGRKTDCPPLVARSRLPRIRRNLPLLIFFAPFNSYSSATDWNRQWTLLVLWCVAARRRGYFRLRY